MVTNNPTVTCDYPDCRSTCQIGSREAETDTLKVAVEKRGWVVHTYSDEMPVSVVHLCPGHKDGEAAAVKNVLDRRRPVG